MKNFLFIFSALSALMLSGANLLDNADFKTLFNGKPVDWGTNLPENFLTVLPGEGVNNTNALKVDFSRNRIFAQGGLRLVPGEKYRISAYVKTKNFSFSRGGIVVPNYLWYSEAGIKKIPSDTNGQWQKLEMEISCINPYHKNPYRYDSNVYSFAIFAYDAKGEFMISLPSLEPVSEKAQKESRRLHPFRKTRKVIMLEPLLSQIPAEHGKLELFWPHDAHAAVRVMILTPEKTFTAKGKLKDHRATVTLPELPQGRHRMRVVLNKSAGKYEQIHEELELITVVPARKTAKSNELNNLVKVIFTGKLSSGKLEFEHNKSIWLHFTTDASNISVNGGKLPLEKFNGYNEAFFHAVPGKICIEVAPDSTLTVKQVPEIFVFNFAPTEKNDHNAGTNDMDFWKKYLFPAINTVNISSTWYGGKAPTWMEINAVKNSGRQVIGSSGFHAKKWHDSQAMYDDMVTSYPVINLWGRTLDEIHPGSEFPRISALSRALQQMNDHPSRIYTWQLSGGQMDDPQYHNLLISAQSNTSQGRGKLLNECYICAYPTMKEQLDELHYYRDNIKRTSGFYPGYTGHILMISGGYSMPGSWCGVLYPEVDFKYVQDMFFNLFANDPAFKGLYGIGMYSLNSSDEELKRWYGALFRHYGIEGHKDMLSDRYGFSHVPGHLKNGDFAEELKYWNASPEVKSGKIKGYGKYQGRLWMKKGTPGDSVAVLSPGATLSQKAVSLVPGKHYSLMYVTAYKSEAENRTAPTGYDHLEATLSGNVKIIEHQIPRRTIGKRAYSIHKIIFQVSEKETEVKFKHSGNVKEDVVLNWVSVKPYFR